MVVCTLERFFTALRFVQNDKELFYLQIIDLIFSKLAPMTLMGESWGRSEIAGIASTYSQPPKPLPPGAYQYLQVFLTGGTAFPGCAKIPVQARKPVPTKTWCSNQCLTCG
jgi:hypothetical protein